jgi:hypothetical protein
MDAVVIGDDQTNVSLFRGEEAWWPVEAKFLSPLLSASFRGEAFNGDICKELTAIYDGRTSEAVIETQDGFISMLLKQDKLGHIEVTAEGRRYSSPEIYARMVFNIDQSYLPAVIASAQRIFQPGDRQ